MMTHAYAEYYLEDARDNLGLMLDFATNTHHYDCDEFFSQFISSGIAEIFENADKIIARAKAESPSKLSTISQHHILKRAYLLHLTNAKDKLIIVCILRRQQACNQNYQNQYRKYILKIPCKFRRNLNTLTGVNLIKAFVSSPSELI